MTFIVLTKYLTVNGKLAEWSWTTKKRLTFWSGLVRLDIDIEKEGVRYAHNQYLRGKGPIVSAH